MKKYKILKKVGNKILSPYRDFEYEIGKKYVCDDFDNNPQNECSRGFYAGDLESLLYRNLSRNNESVFEVEVSGEYCNAGKFKERYSEQTVLREVPRAELISLLEDESEKLGYNLKEALFPINPLFGEPKKVTEKEVELLRQWESFWGSIWASVRESVEKSAWGPAWLSVGKSAWESAGKSVRESVEKSAWGSAWISVDASIWDSIRGYTSSLFPNIRRWEYIDHIEGENPFQPGIDLWRSGFVPSFDGKTWRLHSGKGAEVVYSMEVEK